MPDPRIETNRRGWNEATRLHAPSDFYDVEGFKAGRMSLSELERTGVGDVRGKTLLHLQCHFGLDTLSWARLGARATGVDLSDDSIALARELNDELGLDATFLRANVLDLAGLLDETFDVVYTAMGALTWLPDLGKWAEVVAHHLKPGGLFYLLEIHPLSQIFDETTRLRTPADLKVAYPYFPDPAGTLYPGNAPSYAGEGLIESPRWEWQHSLAEILGSLLRAGLRLKSFDEHRVTMYEQFPGMTRGDDGLWRLPAAAESVPLIFTLTATR